MASHPRADLDDRRRREFRRMVWWSVGLHLFALGVAVSRPAPRAVAPAVIAVELVADPTTTAAAPAPVKTARVEPRPPPPPKPKPAKTVLPAKPSEPKPKAKEPEKPRREEVVIDPAPKQEKNLDDLLADFREEKGEAPPAAAPAPKAAAAVPAAGAAGGSARVSPEVAAWIRRTKVHVRRNWVLPPGFRTEPLRAQVVVKLDAQGNVLGTPEVSRRSGNPWYDEGVVRAVQKASPLPPPPRAGEWDFVFVPEDSY